MQAYGTLGAVRRASIRAAYETVNAGSFDGSTDALVRAVRSGRLSDRTPEQVPGTAIG